MKKSIFGVFGIVLIMGLSILGCGSSNPPAAPLSAFQPEIFNNADNFSFQATAVENVSATVIYNWSNSGAQATVNHSSAVDSGTAVLTIYDANDSLVYTNGLAASLNEPTTVGIAGNWRIRVVLTNCYGTLNFTTQKL